MKILHLRASNFYGGPERQLHLHAREALGTDCEVSIASFDEGGHPPEFLDAIAADGIATRSLPVKSAYDLRAIPLLREYLRSGEFQVLCTHEYRSTTVGWLARRGADVRWIAFSRGFTTENLKVQLYHGIDRLLTRHADHVVAVSEAQKRKVQRTRVPAERISVVPNAIDPASIDLGEAVDLRQRFGLDRDDFVVVSGGRFSREKGQVFLIDAAARALPEAPRLRVLLFGEGPQRQAMLERIERLGLDGRVLCPGFERNMPGCLRDADLLVNPSLSEGMPNIVLEAMAVQTPVLATAVGGVPEIVEDGVTGRLVRSSDTGALAAGLVAAARHPEKGLEMAQRARDFAASELGFDRQFERLREIYRRQVARG
jgi:glycosyltransferase involved in cell wall biosynthesis